MRKILSFFSLLMISMLPALSQASVPVSGIGVRTVYASTNIGTSNWVVLASSLPYTVSEIAVADTSGQTLEIGMCAADAPANSEVRQFLIPPGGITVHIQIYPTQRISIRAVSATATSGENDLNVLF